MRFFAASLLITVLLISAASAELLVTANPLGQGKFAVLGAYINESTYGNVSGWSLGTIGGYVGYGLTDKLDVFGQLGSATVNGTMPIGVSSLTANGYALNLKYALIDEGTSLPVSVAIGGGYKASSFTTNIVGGGSVAIPVSQVALAVGISKIMAPFIPYGGVAYRSMNSSGTDLGTALNLTVGSAIAWSQQGAVMLEYNMVSNSPKGAGSYTNNQIAAGIAYKI